MMTVQQTVRTTPASNFHWGLSIISGMASIQVDQYPSTGLQRVNISLSPSHQQQQQRMHLPHTDTSTDVLSSCERI